MPEHFGDRAKESIPAFTTTLVLENKSFHRATLIYTKYIA
jgi:hypothetical protein